MRSPGAAALLDAWEWAAELPVAERPVALLARLVAGEPAAAIARLPIGERDRRLFGLREATFGHRMAALVACPGCTESLELGLDVHDLLVDAPPASGERHEMTVAGHFICFRLPDTTDLAAAAQIDDPEAARQELLRRCILSAVCEQAPIVAAELPPPVSSALAQRMTEVDPLGNVELAVSCPSCRGDWIVPFDIAAYLWIELDAWAQRLLADVHALARAYGWGEAEVLALSPARRRIYIEMATS